MNISIFVLLSALLIAAQANAAVDSNPFAKEKQFDFGTDIAWSTSSESMTKTVSAEDSYYHLFFNGRQLRIRITTGKIDDEGSAKSFDAFAVNDIMVDGERNAIFQWCLNNQERHSRFLQQGLSVKKDICINDGAHGVYTMQLNQQTIDSLRNGSKLTFVLKPYRTPVELNFDITDFKLALAKMQASAATLATSTAVAPTPESGAMTRAAVAPAPKVKCTLKPPADFAEIRTIDYDCDNEAEKAQAKATLSAQIDKALAKREQLAVENERKRKAEEQARLAKEEKARREKEALAASAALQQELSSDIAKKMIAVCQKKWAQGEHRCYCEKYIEYAPAGIESDPSCAK